MSAETEARPNNVVDLSGTLAQRNAAHIKQIDELTQKLLYSVMPIYTAVQLVRRDCGLPQLDLIP